MATLPATTISAIKLYAIISRSSMLVPVLQIVCFIFTGEFQRDFRVELVARTQMTGLPLFRLNRFDTPCLSSGSGDFAPAFQRIITARSS